jgi:hypothetical protein
MTGPGAPLPDDHNNDNDGGSPALGGAGEPDDLGGMSPGMLRALAEHPEQMADVIRALRGRVRDEDTLLDLLGRASREAVRLLDDAHWAG